MDTVNRLFLGFCCILSFSGQAQSVVPPSVLPHAPLTGYFLSDSIEIGRPFRYALAYHHPPTVDVLFPDTARYFAPYRVQKVAVFATQTTGAGPAAVSRDSAVYTLVSFDTDSIQLLQVPVRIINDIDCTTYWTLADTVFLRSKLSKTLPDSLAARSFTLATETKLAPLQQQFNYRALGIGFVVFSVLFGLLYWLFGRSVRRQWRLYLLNRQHIRFMSEYTQLTAGVSAFTAADVANQAVIIWKIYLERLDPQPYTSLTTTELAERMNDERVTNALREADQMIYGNAFTDQSQSALHVLSDVATEAYHRCREKLVRADAQEGAENLTPANSEEPSLLP